VGGVEADHSEAQLGGETGQSHAKQQEETHGPIQRGTGGNATTRRNAMWAIATIGAGERMILPVASAPCQTALPLRFDG
jgi:hypothetical protein